MTSVRIPPQNMDAEKALIGGMLLDPNSIEDAAEIIGGDCFYNDANRQLFEAITALRNDGKPIDVVAVAEELASRGQIEDVGGLPYLSDLLESVPHGNHSRYYAGLIREAWLKRKLIYCGQGMVEAAHQPVESVEQLLADAESSVFSIVEHHAEVVSDGSINGTMSETLDVLHARIMGTEPPGIMTGYIDVDNVLIGMKPAQLIVMAARPSMGKTALALNVMLHAAGNNVPTLIFSLEQSRLELSERFIACHGKINSQHLTTGQLSSDESDRLMTASAELNELPIWIRDEPGQTVNQMASICRRMKRQHAIRLIVIDYLQLVEPDDIRAPREQQVARMSRRLKCLAKELNTPILLLAQLNRSVELREDKRPRLADLRESGAIEQDADTVIFIHRPDQYDPADRPNEADVIVAKNRNGSAGAGCFARLTFRKEFLRFENYAMPDASYTQGTF